MNDTTKEIVQQALNNLEDCANLLGKTQAKKGYGIYTKQDLQFEVAMHEAIAKHRKTIESAAQPTADAPMDITEMLNLSSMTPVEGYDEIYKHYETTFGRTPDSFMQNVVKETQRRLLMWWGAHRETIRKALVAYKPNIAQPTINYTYTSTQETNCAGCGARKHTPLRIDKMGGYVCLTCIDKQLGSLLDDPIVSYEDFKESVGLMLAAIGYTEEYARKWPKEKVSITFKRWFDEQLENARIEKSTKLPEKTCFMCYGRGWHYAAHAYPPGITAPETKINCNQCASNQ